MRRGSGGEGEEGTREEGLKLTEGPNAEGDNNRGGGGGRREASAASTGVPTAKHLAMSLGEELGDVITAAAVLNLGASSEGGRQGLLVLRQGRREHLYSAGSQLVRQHLRVSYPAQQQQTTGGTVKRQ